MTLVVEDHYWVYRIKMVFLKRSVNFKVELFWKGHTNLKKSPSHFDKSADLLSKHQNKREIFFSNFVAFSQCLNSLPSWPCGLRRRVNSTYNSGMLLYEKIPRSNTHVNKRNYILKRNSCVCMYLLFPEIRSSWKWNRWRYSQLSAGISQWSEKMTCAISTITCTTK